MKLLLRLIALIVDSLILGVISGILAAIIGDVGSIVGLLIGIAYHVGFLSQNNGQTPGKMIFGLRVVSASGGKVTAVQAGLRYIGYFVNTFLLFIGWIIAIFTKDNRGLHDFIAGTKVV